MSGEAVLSKRRCVGWQWLLRQVQLRLRTGPPNTRMNPIEPRQVLGCEGIGYAVRRVITAVRRRGAGRRFERGAASLG
jgi:hypothetical protein